MSLDHRIIEIEAQRNFLGTRCAQYAERVAELEAQLAAKDAKIDALVEQLEAPTMKTRATATVIDDDPEGID